MSRGALRPAFWLSLLAAAALARPAAADDAPLRSLFDGGAASGEAPLKAPPSPPPLPGTDWVPADQSGSVSDGNVSAPEKLSFWSRLQTNSFDSLCRQARIPLGYTLRLWDPEEIHGEFHRYLRQMPTGELAIIDQGTLDVGLGYAPWRPTTWFGMNAHWNIFVGARLAGTSMVIRPLKSHKACEELKRIPNLKDIKPAIPLTAKRIGAMGVGEIWKLPISWSIGASGGAGDWLSFPLSATIGRFTQRQHSVTLRRLDESTLRVRLRLDEAKFFTADGKFSFNIPIMMFGLPWATTAVLSSVSRNIAGVINQYTAVQLDLNGTRRGGALYVVEMLLDPRDAAAMQKLSKLLNGDLSVLKLLRETSRTVKDGEESASDDWDLLDSVADAHEQAMGQPTNFSGFDHYKHHDFNLDARLPLLWHYDRNRVTESDQMSLRDQPEAGFIAHRAERRSRRAYIDLPFLGEVFVRDSQRNAEVVTQKDSSGTFRGPAVVYVHQEGFVRRSDGQMRKMVQSLGDVMRLAGAKGGPDNPRTALPLDELLAPTTGQHPLGLPDLSPFQEGRYRRGTGSLTLVFSAEAVSEFLAASTRSLASAYANSLDGWKRSAAEWVAANASLQDGSMTYDPQKAKEAVRAIADATGKPALRVARQLRRSADLIGKLVKDLDAARSAGGPQEQGEALLRLFSGRGKSGLAYDHIVSILVQLVDPAHLSAEFFLNLQEGERTDVGMKGRFLLHPLGDPMLSHEADAKLRFRQPSLLSD